MELSAMTKTRYAKIAAVLAIENMIVPNSEISLLTSSVEFAEVPVIWLAIVPSIRILTLPLLSVDPHLLLTEQGLIQSTLI
jgi:hypothetical protein